MDWLFLLGIAIFFIGLMASIGLHEIGHLVPAKLFGIKVTQYMVGFGPTMWSRRKGETEYGVKWIPLGGYIRMIGMLPPKPGEDPGKLRGGSTGPFQALIEQAREVALEEVRPGDENRVFYRKKWWQKVIVMSGGPAMNFVLAFILYALLLVGIGVPTYAPVVSPETNTCVIPISEHRTECRSGDQPTPASQAGLKAGDKLVALDGHKIETWEDATRVIRSHGASPAELAIIRDGSAHDAADHAHRPGPAQARRARRDREERRLPRRAADRGHAAAELRRGLPLHGRADRPRRGLAGQPAGEDGRRLGRRVLRGRTRSRGPGGRRRRGPHGRRDPRLRPDRRAEAVRVRQPAG
ncbi:M50 family metallopeptidase [Nonomuraea ferruginea]